MLTASKKPVIVNRRSANSRSNAVKAKPKGDVFDRLSSLVDSALKSEVGKEADMKLRSRVAWSAEMFDHFVTQQRMLQLIQRRDLPKKSGSANQSKRTTTKLNADLPV